MYLCIYVHNYVYTNLWLSYSIYICMYLPKYTMRPLDYHHNGFMATPALGTQDVRNCVSIYFHSLFHQLRGKTGLTASHFKNELHIFASVRDCFYSSASIRLWLPLDTHLHLGGISPALMGALKAALTARITGLEP